MSCSEKYQKWYFKIIMASVLVLFALVHFFYDPYTVTESIAESTNTHELRAGEPEVRLAVLPDVKPGELYKGTARVAWDAVQTGGPAWKTARVVFLNYNKQGDWIPSPFKVCGVEGSGDDFFEEVLQIPEGAVSARLAFQHRGKTGWIRLDRFSLHKAAIKNWTPVLFVGLQAVWFLAAVWTIWHVRRMRRWSGIPVVLVAGLIAAGMLIPGKVVQNAPDQMADLVRPADPPAKVVSSAPAEGQALPSGDETQSRTEEAVQNGRNVLANEISRLNFNLLGHAGLFLLLGAASGVCFKPALGDVVGLFSVFAGGVVYAVAAELLQATELTRTVRISDIGVNVLGWLTGLGAVVLICKLWNGSGKRIVLDR